MDLMPTPQDAAKAMAGQLVVNANEIFCCDSSDCRKAYSQCSRLLFEQLFERFDLAMTELRTDRAALQVKVEELEEQVEFLKPRVPGGGLAL